MPVPSPVGRRASLGGPCVSALVVVALTAPAAAAGAQGTEVAATTAGPVIDSGAHVRVTARRARLRREAARVVAVWPDSIRLAPTRRDLAPFTLSLRDLDALDLGVGRSAGAGARRGAAIGALVVLVPGAAITTAFLVHDYAAERRGRCNEWCYFGPVVFGVLTAGGTAIGAASGALIGAAVGAERWRPVRLPGRVSAAPLAAPSRGGLALGVTLTR